MNAEEGRVGFLGAGKPLAGNGIHDGVLGTAVHLVSSRICVEVYVPDGEVGGLMLGGRIPSIGLKYLHKYVHACQPCELGSSGPRIDALVQLQDVDQKPRPQSPRPVNGNPDI